MLKQIFAVMIALVWACSVGLAQDTEKSKPTAEERADKQTQRLTKALNLTEDQAAKVKTASLKRIQTMQNTRNEEKGKGKGKKIKATMDEFDQEIKAILTPEQYTQYEKRKDELKEKMEDKREEKKGKRGNQ